MSERLTKEIFIERAKAVHGDKYDYSKVNYVNSRTKVEIVCPVHGSFFQRPKTHLDGKGCKKCGVMARSLKLRKSEEAFVKDYYEKFPNSKYDLSKANYVSDRGMVNVICPIHGCFKIKANHLMHGCGCKECTMSTLERKMKESLDSSGYKYKRYKHFKWLGLQSLDFYLPELKIGIECQGDQHFRSIEHFGGPKKLDLIIERDERKKRLCKENGVKLVYFLDECNTEFMTDDDVYFTDAGEMIKTLKEEVQ
jgi:hypothetical protein